MQRPAVMGIGEILWDILPGGEHLGGAPANFSYIADSLGMHGMPVSTVGADSRGQRALQILKSRGIATAGITVSSEYPTGYVEARLDRQGIASYHFPEDTAWDHLIVNDWAREMARTASAVCFGSLVQRSPDSRRVVGEFLEDLPDTVLKVFDVNLRQAFYSKDILHLSLSRADILKLNDEELPVLAGLFDLKGDDRQQLELLLSRYRLQLVILTRGARGSLLLSEETLSDHPGLPVDPVDTVGAGDSFTAAVTAGLLLGLRLDEINDHANRLAAYVCGERGAMPVIPTSFRLLT